MRFLFCFVAVLVILAHAYAGEPAPRPAVARNDDALAKLKALPPNHAVLLGKAQLVGEFNEVTRRFELDKHGPRGRDYCEKLVWAPERRRALYCGANHGVPHRLNDVWEFDLAGLSWILLYAPDNARGYGDLGKDFSDVEYKDGVLITKRGGPAVIAHTWWGLGYDPEQKAMLFMNTWVTDMKKAVEQLGGDPAKLYAGPPLWAFFPAERRWQPLTPPPPYPRAPFGGMLEYVPELRGSIWHTNNWQMQATWLYDARTNTWKNLKANGDAAAFAAESPQPEQVGYYDPDRKIIVAHRHKETFHFSPAKNEWKKVLTADKDAPDVPFGHDAHAPMYHDPKSGHGLLVEWKTNTLWAYDPDKPLWKKLQPEGDALPPGHKRLAYFDPAQNVFVAIDGTTVWCYRYR